MAFIPNDITERNSFIANEAKRIAYLNPSASNTDNWFEAEKIIDNSIFSNDLSLKNTYKSLMIKFFASVDLNALDNRDVAKEYFDFIFRNEQIFNFLDSCKKEDSNIRNISLLTQDVGINYLTKKSLMLAQTSLFGHNPDSVYAIKYKSEFYGTAHYDASFGIDSEYFVHCKEINEIG